MALEEPSYTVLSKNGSIEIRRYQPYVVAETFVPLSEMDEASTAAFKKLFKYISGENQSAADISMTAPVTTTRSEKIAMTAPVATTRSVDGFVTSFMVQGKYTMQTAPIPLDSTIRLREVPARVVAVISFSGRWTESNMSEHEQELAAWIKENGHRPIGIPVIARYDPPFMPWFWRRNEIQIEISPDAAPQ